MDKLLQELDKLAEEPLIDILDDESDDEGTDFVVHINDFSGPIEALYYLISRKKYDINTVPLALVVEPYMEYMKSIDSVDINKAYQFTIIAAKLLEIKMRAVIKEFIPDPEPEEIIYDDYGEEYDYADPEEELRSEIKEYAQIVTGKSMGQLRLREITGRFYRTPEFTEQDAAVSIKKFSMDKMLDAYVKILFNVQRDKKPRIVAKIDKERYTVREKQINIFARLKKDGSVKFSDLFAEDKNKLSVINTFLALLELLKKQLATAVQDDMNDEIIVELGANVTEETSLEKIYYDSTEEDDNYD